MADAPKLLGTDTLRTAYPKVNMAIDNANEALRNSEAALNKATQALANSENTQAQLDQIVIEGDSSVEAAQARVDADGNVFSTLKERLDTKETQFANEIGILYEKNVYVENFPKLAVETDDTGRIQRAIDYYGDDYANIIFANKKYTCGTLKFRKNKNYIGNRTIIEAKAGLSGNLIETQTGNSMNEVSIRGFVLDCNQQTSGDAINVTGGFNKSAIEFCDIINPAGFGILVYSANQSSIRFNRVFGTRGWDGLTVTISNYVNIAFNQVYDSHDSGIGFTASSHITCIGNIVDRSNVLVNGNKYAPAIDASGAKYSTITGNIVKGAEVGIQIVSHPNTGKRPIKVTVSGNTVYNCTKGILVGNGVMNQGITQESIDMESIHVSGNTVTDCQYGIWIVDAKRSSVKTNIVNEAEKGILLDKNDGITVSNNDVRRTTALSGSIGIQFIGTKNNNVKLNENEVEGFELNYQGNTGTNFKGRNNSNAPVNYNYSGNIPYLKNWDFYSSHLKVGNIQFWHDGVNQLFMKAGNPTSETDGEMIQTNRSGSTANRPPFPQVGTQFFDTTLGKPIWCKSTNPNVWVDANGTVV